MNMALLESSQEVLWHWEARIESVSMLSLKLDHKDLTGTFSEYRVRLQSKFEALQKPFVKRLNMIEAEHPLRFAFIPITPQWRNRLIVALLIATLGASGRFLWAKAVTDVQEAQ